MEHSAAESALGINLNGEALSALTYREIEILRWCAAGKTAAEIGTILDLKSRTVNFHVGRAVRKMGVNNKTQAAVQAALSGVFMTMQTL